MMFRMKNQLRFLGLFFALVLGISVAHTVHAVPIFSECQAPTADATFMCLAPQDCTTSGGSVEYQGCGLDNPGGVCCRQSKVAPPVNPSDACGQAGGSCKPFCTPNFETENSGISCSSGYVCCSPAAVTHSNDCSVQGGDCKPSCGSTDESVGTLGCLDGYICCKPSALVTSSSTAQTKPEPTETKPQVPQVNSPDRLVMPDCTKSGDCTLDDVVQTGINFATFIMGLSGALFFAVFIYGGAMYLASFGNKSRVETGKKAIRGAVIGMVFVIGAWTIVNTLKTGLESGKSPSDLSTPSASALKPEEKCPALGVGYSCVTLSGNTSQEAMADGQSKGYSCVTGKCPGAVNILCCKQ